MNNNKKQGTLKWGSPTQYTSTVTVLFGPKKEFHYINTSVGRSPPLGDGTKLIVQGISLDETMLPQETNDVWFDDEKYFVEKLEKLYHGETVKFTLQLRQF